MSGSGPILACRHCGKIGPFLRCDNLCDHCWKLLNHAKNYGMSGKQFRDLLEPSHVARPVMPPIPDWITVRFASGRVGFFSQFGPAPVTASHP